MFASALALCPRKDGKHNDGKLKTRKESWGNPALYGQLNTFDGTDLSLLL
jgi:hypothetical protein